MGIHRGLAIAVTLLSAASCAADTPATPTLGVCAESPLSDQLDRCNYLVGDSTFALVLAHSATPGNADAGCGFLDDAGLVRAMPGGTPLERCQIDWQDDTPNVEEGGVVVVGVSIHDAMCRGPVDDPDAYSCEIDASAYRDVVQHYSGFADVVVVEVPPVDAEQNPGFAENANPLLSELNQLVADALGCELVPSEIRSRAPFYDGLHYVPGEYLEPTAVPLLGLDSSAVCVMA